LEWLGRRADRRRGQREEHVAPPESGEKAEGAAAEDRQYLGVVCPMTHWDRAWYETFQGFRWRLVGLVDKLLAILERDPSYPRYTLDGQTVVLEDYLEIRPERRADLERFVRERRLSVGPWYVLPDEFLVSGEALIRNLLIGRAVAESFGRTMRAGYLPDPFGHCSQLPAVLSGFGLDSLIFSRGAGGWAKESGPVFKWFAADGKTWVHAVHQVGGYANLKQWGVPVGKPDDTDEVDLDLTLERVERTVDLHEGYGGLRHRTLLLSQGVDHQPAQPTVPRQIEHVNRSQSRVWLVQGDFEDFVDRVRGEGVALEARSGELHSGRFMAILSGVFSARMWIKQENHRAQKMLEELAEPACAWEWALGGDYPQVFFTTAWKHLLKCHPHDDICGCSIDEVHEDNAFNFRAACGIARKAADEAGRGLLVRMGIPASARPGLLVFNGSFHARPAEVTGRMFFPSDAEDGLDPAKVHLEAPDGRALPVAARVVAESFQWTFTEGKGHNKAPGRLVDLTFFDPALPASGYRYYRLVEGRPKAPCPLRVGPREMENEFLRVRMNADGSVGVLDKETGLVFGAVNHFEDAADAGDEYDFSPLPGDRPVRSLRKRARIVRPEKTPWSASLSAEIRLPVPESLSPDRRKRSGKKARLGILTTARLLRGARRVDFRTVVDNSARDHRLRAVFPTPVSSETVEASQHFDVVTRAVDPVPGTEEDYQPAVPTQHMDEFVSVAGEAGGRKAGAAVASVGLPEYEARKAKGGVELCLTLLRCVGWLSRGDLVTRPEGAGPALPTPGAQCPGTHVFEYSFIPHGADWLEAGVHHEARSPSSPVHVVAVPPVPRRDSAEPRGLPEEKGFLSAGPDEIVVTAVKRSEDGRDLVVRFFNIGREERTAELVFGVPLAGASLARMDETPLDPLSVEADGRTVRTRVGAREIVTLRVSPAGRTQA
jgi:alpha-mannosidase